MCAGDPIWRRALWTSASTRSAFAAGCWASRPRLCLADPGRHSWLCQSCGRGHRRVLHFPGGETAAFDCSFRQAFRTQVEVAGSEATLIIDRPFIIRPDSRMIVRDNQDREEQIGDVRPDPYECEVEAGRRRRPRTARRSLSPCPAAGPTSPPSSPCTSRPASASRSACDPRPHFPLPHCGV